MWILVVTHVCQSRYFDDFKVGDKFVFLGRTITDAENSLFAGICGDFNPGQVNEEVAKKTYFGGRVIFGHLTLSIAIGQMTLIGVTQPTAVALVGIDMAKFLAPVKIGDTITPEIEILEKRETSKPDRGLLTLRHTVRNQRNQLVFECESKVLLYRRPSRGAAGKR